MWCAVEPSECCPQKVTGRVSPTSLLFLHSFHCNQGEIWKRIDQTFGTWPFFTPLKFRITSGCQRVTLSKSFTPSNIVCASVLFFLCWKLTHSERGWPAWLNTLNWGAVGKQSYENRSYFTFTRAKPRPSHLSASLHVRPDPGTHVASLFSYSFIFQPIFFLHSPLEESVITDSCVLAGVHVLFSLAVLYFAHITNVSAKLSNSLWACKQQNIVAAGCYRSQLSIYLCLQVNFLAIRPRIVTTWGGFLSRFPAVLQWCLKITHSNCR